MPYSLPPEWAPHEATLIAWPHNKEHWPGNYEPIPKIFAEFIQILAESEKVMVCVNDEKMEEEASSVISSASCHFDRLESGIGGRGVEKSRISLSRKIENTRSLHSPRQKATPLGRDDRHIEFLQTPTNASWTRDHGPIVVRNQQGQRVVLDWIFNCWGEKYPPWDLDDRVPTEFGKIMNIPVVSPGMVLEGGSIDVNGKGSLLTTRQCLLNKNRNPSMSQSTIEAMLKQYLGAANILWLNEGIIGDDTDGHIDDIARFVNETTIVAAVEENSNDENYPMLQKNLADLKKMRDQDGRSFTIVSLPMPDPVRYQGQRLPASYLNFYIANTVVVVPTFRSAKDAVAISTLQKYFPRRKVVGIDAVDWVWGLGACHCSTMQVPRGV